MCIWIRCDSNIKCIKDKSIVITISDDIGNNTAVIEIENSTQIKPVNGRTDIILEFCYIRNPFFIWLTCLELTTQMVLCGVLGRTSSDRTVISVLNGRFDIQRTADPQDAPIAYSHPIIVCDIILNPAISFVGIV